MQQRSVVETGPVYDRMLLAILAAGDTELARELGMSRTTIWRVRTGRAQLSRRASRQLASLAAQCDGARERAQAIADLYELAINQFEVREALATFSVALLRQRATQDPGSVKKT